MGSSNYRENRESYDYVEPRRKKKKPEKTQMELIIEKMKSVEASRKALMQAREGLEDAENQFTEAEEELKRSEAAVMEQIDKLDPETRNMLRGMLGQLNKNSRNNIDRDER